jgi:hypothetical protein
MELDTTLSAAVFEDGDTINLVVPSPGSFNPTTSPSACASVSHLWSLFCRFLGTLIKVNYVLPLTYVVMVFLLKV